MAKKKVRKKNKKNSRKKLKTLKAGWTEEKLKKAEKDLRRKHIHDVRLAKIVFWSTILVIVVGNLLMSVALVPFLAVLNRWFLDLVIVILGLVVGFLFNFLLTSIEHLEDHHKIIAAVIIPIIALVNVIFIVLVANEMIEAILIDNARHNPWLIGILYGTAFVLPYVASQVRKIYK